MLSSSVGGLLESAEATVKAAVARDISLIHALPHVGRPPSVNCASTNPPMVGAAAVHALGTVAAAAAAAAAAAVSNTESSKSLVLDTPVNIESKQEDRSTQKTIADSSSLPSPQQTLTRSNAAVGADQAEVAQFPPVPPRLPSIDEEHPCVDGDVCSGSLPSGRRRLFPNAGQRSAEIVGAPTAMASLPGNGINGVAVPTKASMEEGNPPTDAWIHCWVSQVSDLLEHFSKEINRVRDRVDHLESEMTSRLSSSLETSAFGADAKAVNERCWLLENRLAELGHRSEEFRVELQAERESRICDIAQLRSTARSLSSGEKLARSPSRTDVVQQHLLTQAALEHAARAGRDATPGPEASTGKLKVSDWCVGGLKACLADAAAESVDVQNDRFKKAAGLKWAAISEDLSELRTRLTEQLSRSDQGTPRSVASSSSRTSLPSNSVASLTAAALSSNGAAGATRPSTSFFLGAQVLASQANEIGDGLEAKLCAGDTRAGANSQTAVTRKEHHHVFQQAQLSLLADARRPG